jgi:rubrerythrin
MKRMLVIIGVLFFAFVCGACYVQAQGMMGQSRTGSHCPMCGQGWDGMYAGQVSIPKELSKPKSQKWIDNLREILAFEELSKLQYEQDSQKFQANMPYMMVIPQENNHIQWIKELLTAYGLPTDVKVPSLKETADITQAFEYAMKIESDLIPRYEWLIKNSEDETARNLLGTILLQTRMHYTMFNHALWMGGRMGMGMGRGMMGW